MTDSREALVVREHGKWQFLLYNVNSSRTYVNKYQEKGRRGYGLKG
jgi:hypothetical protein